MIKWCTAFVAVPTFLGRRVPSLLAGPARPARAQRGRGHSCAPLRPEPHLRPQSNQAIARSRGLSNGYDGITEVWWNDVATYCVLRRLALLRASA